MNGPASASHDWPLFHYTSASTALDHVLAEARLRLNTPRRTNDPFESEPLLVTMPEDEPVADNSRLGITVQTFHGISDLLRDRARLGCLTAADPNKWTSLDGFGDGWMRSRMWAQYADNHAGVCLAFDSQRLRESAEAMSQARGLALYQDRVTYRHGPAEGVQIPLSRVRRAAAADKMPCLIDDIFPTVVDRIYFNKAWDWNTESEHRIIAYGDVEEFEYVDIRRALTGIFLGPRFPPTRTEDVIARCRNLAGAQRIFLVVWRNGSPTARPLQGPRADRVRDHDWELPPPPADPQGAL